MIGVTPIESLFANIKLDQDGIGDESTLARRRPNNLESDDLNEKIDKSGIGWVKTLTSDDPSLLDFKDFNYENCSLIDVFPCCNPCLIHLMLIIKIKFLLNISWML